ncbi:MAG: aminopeptidase [Coprobacillus sp.]
MNKEQLFEKGINNSLTHVDFMMGTSDLSIIAKLSNGKELVVFKDGNFAF